MICFFTIPITNQKKQSATMQSNITINILMNNLASLKSQLLLQYTEQSQNRSRKTFYQHHNLPTRNLLRSSEGKHKSTSNKLIYQISQQKSGLSKISSLSQQISGRNIFVNPEKEKLPGPGFYEPTINRYSSFGYIKKEESHILSKAARRLKRKEFVNECRGPGSYSPEKAFNFTSKSHSTKQGSFPIGKITRSILPQQSTLQIHLTSSTNFKKPERKPQLSPSSYDIMKAASKTSNFFNPPVHKISMTQRSNIARQNTLPGPGAYEWSKLYELKSSKQSNAKPKVEYKFIYGHPS